MIAQEKKFDEFFIIIVQRETKASPSFPRIIKV